MFVAGVDGCGPDWIAVALTKGKFAGAARFSSFRDVLRALDDAAAIAVNVPIGVIRDGERICDARLLALVGDVRQPQKNRVLEVDSMVRKLELQNKKRSSRNMSLAPDSPPVGGAPDSRRHNAMVIKNESRESLRRFARLYDPDGEQRAREHAGKVTFPGGRIIEAHAEASFLELNGEALRHADNTPEGMTLRLRLLQDGGLQIPTDLGQVGGIPLQEMLDGAAIAWSVHRYTRGHARSLPSEAEWQHDGEHVVAIWV